MKQKPKFVNENEVFILTCMLGTVRYSVHLQYVSVASGNIVTFGWVPLGLYELHLTETTHTHTH